MPTLNKILIFGKGEECLRFGNADGKRWIMPCHGMRRAMMLYQPGGIKGKLVKALLPLLYWLPAVRKAIKAESLNCTLSSELQSLLGRLFGVEKVGFSIFEGTPSVHKKITMQLTCNGKILGYCKVTENKDIAALFARESDTLALLRDKGVKNIPQVLFCGTLSNGVSLFVQSTIKSHSSKMTHRWGALQENFLATLHESTKQAILFEESDFYNAITTLREHIDWLPSTADKEAVAKAVETILNKHKGKVVEYSAYHADFTPWNMFVEKGELFVFDFEYSALTYPPGLDRYHFELQTAVFEKRTPLQSIIGHFMAAEWAEKERLAMYLLDVMSRFTLREKGKVSGDVAGPFEVWSALLKEVLQ